MIHRVENDPTVPPRAIERRIPRDLETIVLKALAKSPDDRFGTAKEMADELRLFLDNRPIRSRPIPGYQQFGRWCKRNPGLAGASLTAVALVVVLAVGATLSALTYRNQLKQFEASESAAGSPTRRKLTLSRSAPHRRAPTRRSRSL